MAAPALPMGAGAPPWLRAAVLRPRLPCPRTPVLWLHPGRQDSMFMPAAPTAACRRAHRVPRSERPREGHGNLRCTARASAPSGACQAWAVAACLLVRGGSGQHSYLPRAAAGSQQPARQVQRQQQACTSGGGGGPGCPVNATAGCNLCTGAKGTYHPPRYMKRKKIRGKISEIAV